MVSPEAREFRDKVREALKGKRKVEGKIALDIEFHFKDKRHRDLDNYLKALIDALKDVAFEDDSMIFKLSASKYLGICDKTLVTVKKL